MSKTIGILTAGGDSPGLNAALRGVGKALHGAYGSRIIGFRDGFRGLAENRSLQIERDTLSGILTIGGTILGTSRDKPHRMSIGGETRDMVETIVHNYKNHKLDALVCLGGGGTQKNALVLKQAGLKILTLPKTIDNDVAMTDTTMGFDTAMGIATEAIDRLHSTAHSHHRIVVVEVMGHRAGWLALGAGIAGGADAILIPELNYRIEPVVEAVKLRAKRGRNFSIVAVAEGAISQEDAALRETLELKKDTADSKLERKRAKHKLARMDTQRSNHTLRLAQQLEHFTGLESRLTILGHLQRGGTPSATDRLLATRLGTACADLISAGVHGVMVAVQGDGMRPVPLEDVAGQRKLVPSDHPWLDTARNVGTCLGN
ncbi:6-phosphofructokinase [Achromatium sp. WMS2]|nr:6-phosphofructokinase [Achromatium sp. WMS2]